MGIAGAAAHGGTVINAIIGFDLLSLTEREHNKCDKRHACQNAKPLIQPHGERNRVLGSKSNKAAVGRLVSSAARSRSQLVPVPCTAFSNSSMVFLPTREPMSA